jgi:hypothetical protein
VGDLLFKKGDRVETVVGIVGNEWDWQPGQIVDINTEENPFGEDYPYHVACGVGVVLREASRVRPAPVSGGSPDAGHAHTRDCYDDAGPGRGGVSLICNNGEPAPSLANDLLAQRLWLGEPVPPEADEAKSLAAEMFEGFDSPEGKAAIQAALDAGIPEGQVRVLAKYGAAYPDLAEMRLADEAITAAVTRGVPWTDAELDFIAAANVFQDTLDDLPEGDAEDVLAFALGDLDHLGLARVLGKLHRPDVDRAIGILTGGADPAEVETAKAEWHIAKCRKPQCPECERRGVRL